MQSQTTLGLCESTMAWKGSYETELIFFTLSLEKNLLFFKFIVNRFFFLVSGISCISCEEVLVLKQCAILMVLMRKVYIIPHVDYVLHIPIFMYSIPFQLNEIYLLKCKNWKFECGTTLFIIVQETSLCITCHLYISCWSVFAITVPFLFWDWYSLEPSDLFSPPESRDTSSFFFFFLFSTSKTWNGFNKLEDVWCMRPWICMHGAAVEAVAAKIESMENVKAWSHMCWAEVEWQAEAVQILFPLRGAIHATAAGLSQQKRGTARFFLPKSSQDVWRLQ